MSSLGQGDDKVTKDLLYIGSADVNAVDARGNNVLKYSFVAPTGKGKLAKTTTTTTTTMQSSSNNNQAEDKERLPTVAGNDRNTRLLLRGGVDVTVCDADGNFPLHWLCRGTSILIILTVCEYNIDATLKSYIHLFMDTFFFLFPYFLLGVFINFEFRGKHVKLLNNVQISKEAQKKGYSTSRATELLEKGAVMVSNIVFYCFFYYTQ